jgi:hypothetical protein
MGDEWEILNILGFAALLLMTISTILFIYLQFSTRNNAVLRRLRV